MIKVTIFDNIEVISSIFSGADENTRVAWAQENEKGCGYCVFNKDGEIIEIVDKENVGELLLRAALNYLDLRDVKTGFCKNSSLKEFLQSLGFKENDGALEVNIRSFFKPCCS